jgi:nucleolar protein 4
MKGKKGRPEVVKSFDRVMQKKVVGKGEQTSMKGGTKWVKPKADVAAAADGDDGKQKGKAQIIQKKRMMRRNRKQGA